MSTAPNTEVTANRVSVHFPDDVLSEVDTTFEKVKSKGFTRNYVITESTRAGLPKTLKRLLAEPDQIPFSESVAAVVKAFTKKQNITTEVVCEKMRERGFDIEESDLISKVSQCLVRLAKKEVVKFHHLDGRKRVYRRV